MIITVGAEKGGVAKTRLSTNLAAVAACKGAEVVLLDTDRQGSAMSWVRIRNDEGVTPNIPAFAIPPRPAVELANLSGKYDLVVVDIGAQNYQTMLECSLLSDLVLIPCGPDQQEIESTLNVFAALRNLDARHEKGKIPIGVVLTRVSNKLTAKATADLRDYFKSEGVPVLGAALAHREAWRASGKTGRAVHELRGSEYSAKAHEEMEALYEEIVKLAQKE